MLDMKFLRENPEIVKENIKKKFQDHKIELVDKVLWIKRIALLNNEGMSCEAREML